MHDTNPLYPVILGVVLFATIPFLISKVAGWASLAERYRCEEAFAGPRWNFQCGQFRWLTAYNNCLTVGADQRGLFLWVFWPLRLGHPPLFIPWRDISVSRKKILWMNQVRFLFGREPAIPLTISDRLAEKLKSAAGESWPVESDASTAG
jgi:hypothetical protein